jgi:hypothetical protein
MKKIHFMLVFCLFCMISSMLLTDVSSQAGTLSVSSVRKVCSSSSSARSQMTSITFKVWNISGKRKVTRIKTILVNRRIAKRMKQAFVDIYHGKEKFPIYEVGGFNWRGSTQSLHSLGLAVDINSNENYMVDHGKVLCGSFWKPGKNPYSIKKNGDVVRAMRKNGFKQCIWGSRKDYMHFSVGGY